MWQRPRWPGWRNALQILVGSDLSTRNLASALAVGALVSPTPVLGLHTWMAVGLAFLFRLNRLAAFVGSNIANPLTMAAVVWADVQVGARLLGRQAPSWPGWSLDWRQFQNLYLEAWIGALVIGPALMVTTFLLSSWLLDRARRRTAGLGQSDDPARPE